MITVTHKFTRRRAPIALVTVVAVICGLGLMAYFARDLVEFATASASATPDYYPTPIMRAP